MEGGGAMNTPAKSLSIHFRLYEERLRRLHSLIAANQSGSEEARELRREMEAPGMELSEEEVERATGISADLYMLSGREVVQPVEEARPSPDELFHRLRAAWEGGDWGSLLALLRRGPATLPPAQVAYLRARAYDELGHTATAALFMRHAVSLEPRDDTYPFMAMELLLRAGDLDAAAEMAEAYLPDECAPLAARIQGAAVLFATTRGMAQPEARPVFERLAAEIPTLTGAAEFSHLLASVQALAYVIRGFCHEGLDQTEEAMHAFGEAIAVDPQNTGARVARGLLAAQADPAAAVRDFVLAVEGHSPLALPYLYLALDAFRSADYADCKGLCEKALRLELHPRNEAVIRELLALARLALNEPLPEARAAFQAALTIDPLNEGLRRNFEYFEQMQQSQPSMEWRRAEWPHVAALDLQRERSALRDAVGAAA
jgi:tetratricopeptide (TPR) repeat protein